MLVEQGVLAQVVVLGLGGDYQGLGCLYCLPEIQHRHEVVGHQLQFGYIALYGRNGELLGIAPPFIGGYCFPLHSNCRTLRVIRECHFLKYVIFLVHQICFGYLLEHLEIIPDRNRIRLNTYRLLIRIQRRTTVLISIGLDIEDPQHQQADHNSRSQEHKTTETPDRTITFTLVCGD